ncbi:low affinity immunoglobulin epsilon Fc receptor-like [Patiria miniata]|uniref:C-type lectin domain-containing protein n=1 Tax=Patiria miniata TaxID=46514 RepID=A0A914ASH6_PATMI|nr:low affinity immunoglobulin epsilon Fc receptor-like [Patiria miniata]
MVILGLCGFLVAVKLIATLVSAANDECPENWKNYGDRCYVSSVNIMQAGHGTNQGVVGLTWEKAGQACQGVQASLLILNSREEWQSISDYMGEYSYSWLGCQSTAGEEFACGNEAFYSLKIIGHYTGFWLWEVAPGPRTSTQTETCVRLDKLKSGTEAWMVESDCTTVSAYICERPLEAIEVQPGAQTPPVPGRPTAGPAASLTESGQEIPTPQQDVVVCPIIQEPINGFARPFEYEWLIPRRYPCACTKLRIGGVNVHRAARPYRAARVPTLVQGENAEEIRDALGCVDVVKPVKVSDISTENPGNFQMPPGGK